MTLILDESDVEPCDVCRTGISLIWGWDGRRRCRNCCADLEVKWLRQRALNPPVEAPASPASPSAQSQTHVAAPGQPEFDHPELNF